MGVVRTDHASRPQSVDLRRSLRAARAKQLRRQRRHFARDRGIDDPRTARRRHPDQHPALAHIGSQFLEHGQRQVARLRQHDRLVDVPRRRPYPTARKLQRVQQRVLVGHVVVEPRQRPGRVVRLQPHKVRHLVRRSNKAHPRPHSPAASGTGSGSGTAENRPPAPTRSPAGSGASPQNTHCPAAPRTPATT